MQIQPYLMFDGRRDEALEFYRMASDGQCQGQPRFQGFSLSISAADDEDAKRRFAKTFFASSFGMVADKFGVSWMIVAHPQEVSHA
jgi:uncharacterized glyoxalase superfamily protein PhnB